MWEERRPQEGETVKIEFADWTKLGTKIGVFLRYSGGRSIVDIGDRLLWLGDFTTFLVWDTKYIMKTS